MTRINESMGLRACSSINKVCILFFVILAYLSYSIPMIYSYFESVNFIYVNAWDEETYLSYQGALGAMKVPGYWASGALVYTLQNMGVSGGEINLLFDCVLTPVMFCILAWSFKACGISVNNALFFSVILLFSPILFNYGNPLVSNFFPREYGAIGFGYEPYQSILRTPEPQLSYFLISLCIAYYIRIKKIIALLIVLPFLYFYVAIAYVYFLIAIFAFDLPGFLRDRSSMLRITAACFISYSIVSAGFFVFDYLFLSKEAFLISSKNLYIKSHTPIIPLAGLFVLGLFAVQVLVASFFDAIRNHYNRLQYFIVLSIFFVSNIHVVSGVMLSYKNYMDYVVGFMGGAGVIVFLRFWFVNELYGARFISCIFVTSILLLTFNAYGFSFKTFEYSFFRGLQFKSEDYYKFVSQNPMSIVIPNSDLSAKIPYSVAKMPIPIFSYQYNFPIVGKECGSILGKMVEAVEFLKINDPEVYALNKNYFLHSIDVFSGRHLLPMELTGITEQSDFCKSLAMKIPFQVLKQDFKDNGWQTIKIFGNSSEGSAGQD